MVTKIVNNTDKDVVFYTVNIRNYTETDKGNVYPPVERIVKAGETLYSRSVTGDTSVEDYLTKQGCTLTREYRNLWLIIAGQSNAVGYDETPWDEDDVGAIPYCYFEGLKTHGGYGNADAVPAINAGIDAFQDMQNLGSVGTRTKSLAYPLAKELIGMIPDEYELLISNYSQGMSYLNGGNVGTITGANLPSGSTRWNSDGKLTEAMGRRLNIHLASIQPESKLLGIVWCQGEADGLGNVTVENYKTAFQNTINTLQAKFSGSSSFTGSKVIDTATKVYFSEFGINTDVAHKQDTSAMGEQAFVEFTGGTFVAGAVGTYKYIDRSSFRTNLAPSEVETKYGSAAPVVDADTGAVTFTEDRTGYANIDFEHAYTDGRVGYGFTKSGIKSSDCPIYCAFFNKLNGKYMGYIVINFSSSGATASPAFVYEEANAPKAFHHPLWVVFPGPQKYWNTQGTFKQIIQWQKENFTGFVDLPEDLATNDASDTGSKAQAWNGWKGYGFTSSTKPSHYGQNAFRYIAKKVADKIKELNALYLADKENV